MVTTDIGCDKQTLRKLYRKRAAHYDLVADLYFLIGFRLRHYRRLAVDALQLQNGDTVVDLCCGTGLNFPLLQKKVGPAGKIIGVDLTGRMLEQARARVDRNNWKNIELVLSDVAKYPFPSSVDGVISTMAITLVPEYDSVIQRGATALGSGKRLVIMDLKQAEQMPLWLVKLGVFLTSPYGVNLDLAQRHPWKSMAVYLRHGSLTEFYGGMSYIAVGEAI